MKLKLMSLLLLALALPAAATVTISYQYGTAFTAQGAPVADGTLWAMVVDTDGSNTFAGGFGLNQSLSTTLGADAAFASGQALSVGGTLSGDTIFALGGFNGAGAGITADAVTLTLGVNGVATSRNYAFYWFPGQIYTAVGQNSVGGQVGGINNLITDTSALEGMVIPADSALVTQGAANADGGGELSNTRFTAVALTAIPEPSAALLGAIGALGLLRRRRN